MEDFKTKKNRSRCWRFTVKGLQEGWTLFKRWWGCNEMWISCVKRKKKLKKDDATWFSAFCCFFFKRRVLIISSNRVLCRTQKTMKILKKKLPNLVVGSF